MDFDSTLHSDISSETKISSSKQVYLATFLGGPLAGGWLLLQNLFSINEKKKAYLALIGSIILFFSLIFVAYHLPSEFPSIVLPLLIAILYMSMNKLILEHKSQSHTEKNGLITSWWSIFGVSLVSLGSSIIFIFLISYGLLSNSNDVETVDKTYPNLKEMSVSLDAIPTILNEVKLSQIEGAFAAFAFSDFKDPSDALNIQFSFENGQVGLDWVLMGAANKRDRKKYEEYLNQLNITFQLKTENGVSYLRTVNGDLAVICKKVIIDMYKVSPKEMIEVYYQGINFDKYIDK